MLHHQAVGCAGDDHELGVRQPLCELLAVAAWREDVLVAHDHERRDGDLGEPIGERLVGGEDRPHLRHERMRRAAHGKRSEPAECRQ